MLKVARFSPDDCNPVMAALATRQHLEELDIDKQIEYSGRAWEYVYEPVNEPFPNLSTVILGRWPVVGILRVLEILQWSQRLTKITVSVKDLREASSGFDDVAEALAREHRHIEDVTFFEKNRHDLHDRSISALRRCTALKQLRVFVQGNVRLTDEGVGALVAPLTMLRTLELTHDRMFGVLFPGEEGWVPTTTLRAVVLIAASCPAITSIRFDVDATREITEGPPPAVCGGFQLTVTARSPISNWQHVASYLLKISRVRRFWMNDNGGVGQPEVYELWKRVGDELERQSKSSM